jgi:hypothetical protein
VGQDNICFYSLWEITFLFLGKKRLKKRADRNIRERGFFVSHFFSPIKSASDGSL